MTNSAVECELRFLFNGGIVRANLVRNADSVLDFEEAQLTVIRVIRT